MHLLGLFVFFGANYRICCVLGKNEEIFLQEIVGFMWI